MFDCIKHMTTIGQRRKQIFICPHTNWYSRKKHWSRFLSKLEKVFVVESKVKAIRSSSVFNKAYATSVDYKVTIYPCFGAIAIVGRFPFADFSHFTFASSKVVKRFAKHQNNQRRSRYWGQRCRTFVNPRKSEDIPKFVEDVGMSLSWTKFFYTLLISPVCYTSEYCNMTERNSYSGDDLTDDDEDEEELDPRVQVFKNAAMQYKFYHSELQFAVVFTGRARETERRCQLDQSFRSRTWCKYGWCIPPI